MKGAGTVGGGVNIAAIIPQHHSSDEFGNNRHRINRTARNGITRCIHLHIGYGGRRINGSVYLIGC